MARRKRKERSVKPVYYVFCEGETEEKYVRYLKQYYRIPIKIDSKVKNAISDNYIRKYKSKQPSHPKDRTFVMFDLDKEDTRDKILSLNAELLCSNPCVELWYLLHFKNQAASLSSSEAIQQLERKFPNYQKGKPDNHFYQKLIEKVHYAIGRAKRLNEHKNPSTSVYLLVELIIENSNKK